MKQLNLSSDNAVIEVNLANVCYMVPVEEGTDIYFTAGTSATVKQSISEIKGEDLDVKIFRDGDSICALMGQDLQAGIAGFGHTIYEALSELSDEINIVHDVYVDENLKSKIVALDKETERLRQ